MVGSRSWGSVGAGSREVLMASASSKGLLSERSEDWVGSFLWSLFRCRVLGFVVATWRN